MSTKTATCEIFSAGKIVEPEAATNLGRASMRLYHFYEQQARRQFYGNESLLVDSLDNSTTDLVILDNKYTDRLALGPEHSETALDIGLRFLDICADRSASLTKIPDQDIFVGTPKHFTDSWHVDIEKQYRLVVNLSADPITLKVANSWDRSDFKQVAGGPKFSPKGGIDYREITSNPGEGVFIDNMFEELHDQVPHAGVDIPGKVILRAMCA
ncbi:MAG: hypothetical protein WDN66_03580 [Candidatus Saccharibacteria bacterium]